MPDTHPAGLRVCYFPQSATSIDGSPKALLALAAWIAGEAASAPPILVSPECERDGGHAVTELMVGRDMGPVRISIEGGTLIFGGGADQLGVLAQSLTRFASTGDPADQLAHMHVEYYELPGREHHLAPDAEPLVIGFAGHHATAGE